MHAVCRIENSFPVVLAQQPGGTPSRNREAYEGGQQVGQIAVYVMAAAVVVWGVVSIFKRRKKP